MNDNNINNDTTDAELDEQFPAFLLNLFNQMVIIETKTTTKKDNQ